MSGMAHVLAHGIPWGSHGGPHIQEPNAQDRFGPVAPVGFMSASVVTQGALLGHNIF